MNREIVGGGGASIYPLTGDIASTPGSPTVSVTGLEGVPLGISGLDNGDFLVYDGTSNNWVNTPIVIPSPITLETNGTANSNQSLLNLVPGTNVTLTAVGGAVTISSAGGATGSQILNSWGPQTAVTGNSAFQTMLTYTIPASTVAAGKGIEFDFSAISTTGTVGSNSWQMTFSTQTLTWNGSLGSGAAFGGCQILNLPSSTTTQTFVLKPLMALNASSVVTFQEAVNVSTAFNTATNLTITLQWNGPATMNAQIFQAFVKLI